MSNQADLQAANVPEQGGSMSRLGVLKTVGRVTAMVLLLVAMAGPWTFDSHPATEQTCSAPLVWLGGGLCACLVSPLVLLAPMLKWGPSGFAGIAWLLFLPVLPFVTTLLLLIFGDRRLLRALNLAAWALTAAWSTFVFLRQWTIRGAVSLRLWGVGLCAAVAIAMLVGEILATRIQRNQEPRPAAAGAD
jgi:hypothetical protein